MINIVKGTAHSLSQSDITGLRDAGNAAGQVYAGMCVGITSTGLVNKASSSAIPLGFAINNYTDGDVIESGKVGIYLLDGNSVIETDQFTAGDTPTIPGTPIYVNYDGATGLLTTTSASHLFVGVFMGLGSLPAAEPSTLTPATTYTYVNRAGTTITPTAPKMGWTTVTTWILKLASAHFLPAAIV